MELAWQKERLQQWATAIQEGISRVGPSFQSPDTADTHPDSLLPALGCSVVMPASCLDLARSQVVPGRKHRPCALPQPLQSMRETVQVPDGGAHPYGHLPGVQVALERWPGITQRDPPMLAQHSHCVLVSGLHLVHTHTVLRKAGAHRCLCTLVGAHTHTQVGGSCERS